MFTIVASLLGKFVNFGIPAIIKEIQQERTRQLDAKTEQERIASEERVAALEVKRDILIKSQEDRLNNIVRFLWALPFIIYIWKLLLWDKVLGWGATDALSPTLEYILWTVLGGYFLLGAADKFSKR